MVGKIEKNPQLEIFKTPLAQFIQKDHKLCLLSAKIDWDSLEKDLSVYYTMDNGRPSIPIRKVAGVLILKRIFNESDESAIERWKENPYWQYFCGEVHFQHDSPFDPTELIKFRKRIGEKGAEKILSISINLFERKEIEEKAVLIDTTVQEKNITYPTDTKLHKKIIEKCRLIAEIEGIVLRQSYKRILKQLMIDQRFRSHPRRKKKAYASARKIKTIAGRIVRDLERKLTEEQYEGYSKEFLIFNKILLQKTHSSNKIYSIHEPHVQCIAKGKESKKYEYGNKTSLVKTIKSGIILGALAIRKNTYDGNTLEPQLKQVERLTGKLPRYAIVDRGYRGRKKIMETEIIIPKKIAKHKKYERQKLRKWFRARAGIEPIIGHVKHDHRMLVNYLSGTEGDVINTLLAATGFNMMKMLRRLHSEAQNFILFITNRFYNQLNLIYV
jgi:IS5 family transposase